MAHSSKNGTFLQKWHIPPKCHIHPYMAHSSENGTFFQKWHIPLKMGYSSNNGTFLHKWRIPPKKAHSSKNGTFLPNVTLIHIWYIHLKMAHSSKNDTFLQKWHIYIIKAGVCGHSNVPTLTSPPLLKLLDSQGYLGLPYDLMEVIKVIGVTFKQKKNFFQKILCHSFRISVTRIFGCLRHPYVRPLGMGR